MTNTQAIRNQRFIQLTGYREPNNPTFFKRYPGLFRTRGDRKLAYRRFKRRRTTYRRRRRY